MCFDLTCDKRSVIGYTMINLAATHIALGRHQDALVLFEEALELHRHVLPENHPDIGLSCLNISSLHAQAGDFHRALVRAREALRIRQATLVLSHPEVKIAQEQVRRIEGELARRA